MCNNAISARKWPGMNAFPFLLVALPLMIGCTDKTIFEEVLENQSPASGVPDPNKSVGKQQFMDDGLREPTSQEIEEVGRIYSAAEKAEETSAEFTLVKDAVFAFPLTHIDTVSDIRRLNDGLFVATGEMNTGLYIYKVRIDDNGARVEDCFRYAIY